MGPKVLLLTYSLSLLRQAVLGYSCGPTPSNHYQYGICTLYPPCRPVWPLEVRRICSTQTIYIRRHNIHKLLLSHLWSNSEVSTLILILIYFIQPHYGINISYIEWNPNNLDYIRLQWDKGNLSSITSWSFTIDGILSTFQGYACITNIWLPQLQILHNSCLIYKLLYSNLPHTNTQKFKSFKIYLHAIYLSNLKFLTSHLFPAPFLSKKMFINTNWT